MVITHGGNILYDILPHNSYSEFSIQESNEKIDVEQISSLFTISGRGGYRYNEPHP